MKDTPLLMRSELVAASLRGEKDVTRRLRGLSASAMRKPGAVYVNDDPSAWWFQRMEGASALFHAMTEARQLEVRCPYGCPGDRLWLREAWRIQRCDDVRRLAVVEWNTPDPANDGYNDAQVLGVPLGLAMPRRSNQTWRSPIHMPRWASRCTVEICSVRPERVQSITEEDAKREGVTPLATSHRGYPGTGAALTTHEPRYRAGFAAVWRSMHGDHWERNGYCWRVEYRRIET